jgi:glycogen phosphorylase
MRILLDEEDVPFEKAWNIVTNVFFFTNHTVLPVSKRF